jgi:catechol 2,3-dioxygenase-like lactoylglutathione lyase family enzyme
MLFKRLAHVCLNVQDLQRSLDYYHKLGFRDRFRFTRKGRDYGRYLEIADKTYIEVFEEPNRTAAAQGGLAHFCLETEDLDRLIARLDDQRIPHTPKTQGCDFTWQIWLEDPDGNTFEVHEYSDKSMQLNGGVAEADW